MPFFIDKIKGYSFLFNNNLLKKLKEIDVF